MSFDDPIDLDLEDKSTEELEELADFFDMRADESVEASRPGPPGGQIDELAKKQRGKAVQVRKELHSRREEEEILDNL